MNWRKPIYIAKLSLRTPEILRNLAEYEKTQWYSFDQLKEYQNQQLKKLLKHASQHVPYYARILKEYGVIKGENIVLNEFHNIPFLTKDIIQKNFNELKSDDLDNRKWRKNTSGGSTGEPIIFIQDTDFGNKSKAKAILGHKMAGKDLCESEIVLWGSERDIFGEKETLRNRLDNFISNRHILNSFKMSQDDMIKYIKYINNMKPKLVLAYAQSAYELANFSIEASIPINGVKAVMVSAGTLYPFMREKISQAFKAPVFNRYGSREVGFIATECDKHSGLHISMETQLIEVVNAYGNQCKPGENGEIIITNLVNFAMPLIRYRIGDMGILSDKKCSCGRGSQLLETVTGRVGDTFLTKNMERIYGGYFTYLIYFKEWVKKFQFIQEDFDLITVKIQKRSEPPPEDIKEIEEKIRHVMGQSCKIKFEFVDDILPLPSGKYRYTINNINK